jgi:hypothetical protein
MNIINKIIDYIKNTYYFIYNNYNYKQIFLIFLVFFTIYLVEVITKFNYGVSIPVIPGIPMMQQQQQPQPQPVPKEKISKKIKHKSAKNFKKSKK